MLVVDLDLDAIILSAFEMPALPQSAVRLASIIASDEIELDEVVRVIECDPALTLKLLKIANSVYSSSSRQIGTVRDAVIRLGTGAILGLGVGSCIRPTIVSVIPGYNISGSDFWRHSLAAAMSTETLRLFTKQAISPLAFTAALLHDIGKVVLGNYLEAEVLASLERASLEGNMEVFRAETEILSLHHGELGGVVAQHWGLPDTVVKGISFHHNPESCDDNIAYVTHFANFVAHEVAPVTTFAGFESPKEDFDSISEDLEILGLSENCLTKVFEAVRNRLDAATSNYK